tara:strand:- start:163 stop:762 length:600 start_codon:yes stop_codon:yes gene_type:complete
MKKLLLLFTLTVASYTNAQITTFDNLPISRVFLLDTSNWPNEDEAITIPLGKLWYINGVHSNVDTNQSLQKYPRGQIIMNGVSAGLYVGHIYPEGTKIYGSSYKLNIIEYNLDAQTITLNTNNIQFDNKMKLFPNPTNSRLSLNSEKDYNIEVFDLSGRKIMEAQGNNLDMSNLSKATYIVKAFDKASKETYSYKVIRN